VATAKQRHCIDCRDEGITTKRKAPYPGPRCASHNRAKRTQRRSTSWEKRIEAAYSLTAAEYWLIHEHQGGVCYMCRRAKGTGAKRLSVDHDHKTGIVRGLLCSPCNRGVLGHLRDDPEAFQRGIDYLNNPPAVQAIGIRIAPNKES
jgi:hypothetical protein